MTKKTALPQLFPLWLPVLAAFWLFALPLQVWAAATAVAVTGMVTLTPKSGSTGPLAEGQRVESGASIKTAAASGTTLRFDDGEIVALSANTTYNLDNYKFNAHKPAEGSFTSTLIQGGMRSVTGLLGKLNPGEVKVKTTVATVGIRGTDYQLFLDDTGQLHMHVLEGAISATNRGGEEVFAAGKQPTGLVSDLVTKARAASLSEFPAGVQGAFRQLETNSVINTHQPNKNDPTCADRR